MELQSGPALYDQVGAGGGSVLNKRGAEEADRACNFMSLLGPLGSLTISGRRTNWGSRGPFSQGDAHDALVFVQGKDAHDRRMGCRMLGNNAPHQLTLSEHDVSSWFQAARCGQLIGQYVAGTAGVI